MLCHWLAWLHVHIKILRWWMARAQVVVTPVIRKSVIWFLTPVTYMSMYPWGRYWTQKLLPGLCTLFCEGLPHVWDWHAIAKSCEAASYFHITQNCFFLLILWHFSVVFLCSGHLFLSQASWMTDAVSIETSRQRVGLCVHMLLLAVGGFWFSWIGTFLFCRLLCQGCL